MSSELGGVIVTAVRLYAVVDGALSPKFSLGDPLEGSCAEMTRSGSSWRCGRRAGGRGEAAGRGAGAGGGRAELAENAGQRVPRDQLSALTEESSRWRRVPSGFITNVPPAESEEKATFLPSGDHTGA